MLKAPRLLLGKKLAGGARSISVVSFPSSAFGPPTAGLVEHFAPLFVDDVRDPRFLIAARPLNQFQAIPSENAAFIACPAQAITKRPGTIITS